MSETIAHLRAMPAVECLEKFRAVIGKFPYPPKKLDIRTNVPGVMYVGPVNFNAPEYLPLQSAAEEYRTVEIREVAIEFNVPDVPKPIILTYKSPENTGRATIDLGIFRDPSASIPPGFNVLPILGILEKHLSLVPSGELALSALPEAERKAIEYQVETVKAMQTETARLAKIATDTIKANQEHLQELTTNLEVKFQKREDDLNQQYNQKETTLAEREEALRQAKEEFNTREPRAVRRDLLDKITMLIQDQKQIALSYHTWRKRTVIHFACVVVLLGAAWMIYTFGNAVLGGSDSFISRLLATSRPASATTADWRLFLPLSAALILFASTLVYYLKWNDNWFRSHADAEFRNLKLNSDILRASWIAELFFESESDDTVNLPTEVITAFTRNLFTDPYPGKTQSHPLDSVSGMLGSITKLKVGKGAFEIQTDGTSAKPAEQKE